ncbi:hypothetical protein [Streptomyces bluensis]|nr:hypothetical protein [Streptomyces bluensis]
MHEQAGRDGPGWRTPQHVALGLSRSGDIARAALVLNGIWK